MGWKSKPRNDWGHVNQVIQHFNEYAKRFKSPKLPRTLNTWTDLVSKRIVELNDKVPVK